MSRPRFIILVLILGTLAVYYPVTHHPFTLFDDNDYVTQDPMVERGLSWAGVKWAFTTWHASNWHPLTWLSHMLDCQVFDLNAGAHHTVNLLLHTANVALLFWLLWRLTGAVWPSAFVAALFAWHPMHVESVAWVAERKDVLSTFFALLSLLAYAQIHRPPSTVRILSSRLYWVALLCFALALMAKPMFVTLPFVMLLLDYWPLQRFKTSTLQRLTLEKIPFFALSAASCVVTFLAQHRGGAVASLTLVPLHYRLRLVPLAYAGYLSKLFWPVHLAILYPLPERIPIPAVAASLAVLLALSAAAWLGRKSAPEGLVGWLWFLGTLVPVIGLVQVGSAAMADRYAYFPSIGLFLAVTMGIRRLAARFRFPPAVVALPAGVILAACLFLTRHQLGFWRDDVALFSHAVAVTVNNDSAHINLGVALESSGDKKGAIGQYREALKIDPERIESYNNLANLLDDDGQTEAAIAEYQEALKLNPNYTPTLNNLGTLYLEHGRFEEAMKLYAKSAQLDTNDWHAPYLMGKALLTQNRDREAVPFFRRAVALDPNNPRVLAFLAEVLASDEDPRVRNGTVAYAMADKANALTGGVMPPMLDILGMAYAEVGRFDDARQAAEDATNVATRLDLTNDIPPILRRLEFYQKGLPYRQSFTNTPLQEQAGH